MRFRCRHCTWFGWAVFALAGQALAQKAPEVGYVFPPGVGAGSTSEVQLGGYDWTPDMQFFVSDPRVELALLGPPGDILVPEPPYWFGPKSTMPAWPLPREIGARLTVPAEVPPGPVRWQVANANGGSTHGIFYVGAGFEVVEDERESEPQELPSLPVTVSGRLIKLEDVDRYRFRTVAAGPVTCALVARRLGSNINGVLEVRDAAGRLVADTADTAGFDACLTFAAEAGTEYVASVYDLDFRGDSAFVYRLEITPAPQVAAAVPAAGRRGETRPVEFIGWGVDTGQAKLESVSRTVAFPADPTAASLDYALETPWGAARPFRLLVSDLAERVEPREAGGDARRLDAPIAVTGVLDERHVEDRYLLDAKQGDVWAVSLLARRIGSPLDVALAILGPDGTQVAKNDDLPATTDAGLEFAAPADGRYQVLVADLSATSGSPAAVYRLVLDKPAAGFSLGTAGLVNVLVGGTAELPVTAARQGGFAGPITLAVAGLPPGVSAPAGLVMPPDQSELKIVLQAAADAPATASLVTITGTAVLGEKSVAHAALAPAGGDLAPRSAEEGVVPTVLVTTIMKPRSKVTPVDKDGGRTVHRGTTYPAEVIVERLEGFEGEVLLRMAARQTYHQQGIRGFDVVVPPGVSRIAYPCFMPEWLETSRTSRMIVVAVTKVPDPQGNLRHLVSLMDGRITMSIEGALLKIAHASQDLDAQPGGTFEIPLVVSRSAKLPQPVRLELVLADELAGLVSAEPVTVPADQSRVVLRATAAADARLLGDHEITIRAVALERGHLPVVSETTVPITFSAR